MPPRRLLAWALAAVGALAAGAVPALAAGPESSATALAVLVRLPDGGETVVGSVTGPPFASRRLEPEAGGPVGFGAGSTDVRRSPGAGARMQAWTTIDRLSILDGLIVADTLTVRATAAADERRSGGGFEGAVLEGLSVAGVEVEPAPNLRVSLGDLGYVVVLEQAVQRERDGRAYRGFTVALHVYLTASAGGLPAGSELLVGYAEAAAEAPAPPAPEPAAGPSPGDGQPSPDDPEEPLPPPPGATPEPPPIVRDPPESVRPRITGRGYVFPVYGPVGFSDDFGAPRASTGWHHGTDLFARLGAPVLAVADGVLSSVGWNPVGGWRLWLRDGQGNEYYYAHLSAFSPLAESGARVRAGDVIGFVGDTGDAAGTPYHLHFEIHPAALLGLGYDGVVNPYPYLLAWHERRDEAFGAALAAGPAPAPGAYLLEADDISTVSGLEPGGIARALGIAGTVDLLLPSALPRLVRARPGFAPPTGPGA